MSRVTSANAVVEWQVSDVVIWAKSIDRCSELVVECLQNEAIDGMVLMTLTEDDIRDFRYRLNYKLSFNDMKRLWLAINTLQMQENKHLNEEDELFVPLELLVPPDTEVTNSSNGSPRERLLTGDNGNGMSHGGRCGCIIPHKIPNFKCNVCQKSSKLKSCEHKSLASLDSSLIAIPPEFFKTAISMGYSFLVTWITSFVMVIVHERVPDMKKYPPLPDIFLDNVPHIPWAFHMCEITGTLLFTLWTTVCIFHKYRMILLRRFFALAGTVFLLRCVTMLITSLSVPGTHLQCNRDDYAVDDSMLTSGEALYLRISRAYTIWSGLGMSIQGVRTCGDYMFSGHTVALTLLNFFITEYTPRNLYFLHTLTWLLNMFGIFFILAAHEHYSIDVFVAFYITSRLFLYYHTLANNQALMQRDSNRTRIWFPMFSYFEDSVQGIIPNEFDTVGDLLSNLLGILLEFKDICIDTAHRFAIHTHIIASRNLFANINPSTVILNGKQHRNASTSTNSASNVTITQSSQDLLANLQTTPPPPQTAMCNRADDDQNISTENKKLI